MLPVGTDIGSYRLESAVASGGMGVVYRARHRALGHEVAVKMLLPHLAQNPRIRHRFQQEALVQAQLGHPGIVRVLDLVDGPAGLAIVMDFVHGPSLDWVVDEERPGPWSPEHALSVVCPLLEALACAHRAGVVHRDLKPANVLLDRSRGGWPGVPRIADFGVAKVLHASAGMTRTGAQLGTYPYMAPEQFRGDAEIDARADVYAVGMITWRLLQGRLPVNPESHLDVMRLYVGEAPRPPMDGISPALAAAVDRALSLDKAGRPADAQDLLATLEAARAAPGPNSGPALSTLVLEAGRGTSSKQSSDSGALPSGESASDPAGRSGTAAAPAGASTTLIRLAAASLVLGVAAVIAALLAAPDRAKSNDGADSQGSPSARAAMADEFDARNSQDLRTQPQRRGGTSRAVSPMPRTTLPEDAGSEGAAPLDATSRAEPDTPRYADVQPGNTTGVAPSDAESRLISKKRKPDWDGSEVFGSVWRFDTVVLRARKSGAIGVNGYYEVRLHADGSPDPHGSATVELVKTGYGKIHFDQDQLQSSREPVTTTGCKYVPGRDCSSAWRNHDGGTRVTLARTTLRRSDGTSPLHMTVHLYFRGDSLYGYWYYTGPSWESAGFVGVLRGHRGLGETSPPRKAVDQPCEVQCALASSRLDPFGPEPSDLSSSPELRTCFDRCRQ